MVCGIFKLLKTGLMLIFNENIILQGVTDLAMLNTSTGKRNQFVVGIHFAL
jgi:hypothetical protein